MYIFETIIKSQRELIKENHLVNRVMKILWRKKTKKLKTKTHQLKSYQWRKIVHI